MTEPWIVKNWLAISKPDPKAVFLGMVDSPSLEELIDSDKEWSDADYPLSDGDSMPYQPT